MEEEGLKLLGRSTVYKTKLLLQHGTTTEEEVAKQGAHLLRMAKLLLDSEGGGKGVRGIQELYPGWAGKAIVVGSAEYQENERLYQLRRSLAGARNDPDTEDLDDARAPTSPHPLAGRPLHAVSSIPETMPQNTEGEQQSEESAGEDLEVLSISSNDSLMQGEERGLQGAKTEREELPREVCCLDTFGQSGAASGPTVHQSMHLPPQLVQEFLAILDGLPKNAWQRDSRKNILRAEAPESPYAICLGIASSKISPGLFLSSATMGLPRLTEKVLQIAEFWRVYDPGFCYSSAHILRNYCVGEHVDAHNTEPAVCCSVGSFLGGRLSVEVNGVKQGFTTHNLCLLTNVLLKHSVEPFTGARYALILFSRRDSLSVHPSDPVMLRARHLGFKPWPSQAHYLRYVSERGFNPAAFPMRVPATQVGAWVRRAEALANKLSAKAHHGPLVQDILDHTTLLIDMFPGDVTRRDLSQLPALLNAAEQFGGTMRFAEKVYACESRRKRPASAEGGQPSKRSAAASSSSRDLQQPIDLQGSPLPTDSESG